MPTGKTGTGRRSGSVRQVYWPRCAVCQYMKKNPTFRLRVMQSAYFNPKGNDSLATVIHDFGDPFPLQSMYMHMRRHQANDLIKARRRFQEIEHPHAQLVGEAVEGEVLSSTEHERGLDEFIREGRQKLLRKEMPISATNYLAAIKIKADIEKSTKDRRLDMIKNFFAGGTKKET